MDGRSLDLRALCEHCGDELPAGSRSDRMYCGPKCYNASYAALETAARLEEKARRSCVCCGGPIAPAKRRHAVYCSAKCREITRSRRLQERRRDRRAGRRCPECGAALSPDRKSRAIYCSRICGLRARSKAQRRERFAGRSCAECGNVVPIAKRADAAYCSARCQQKAAKRRARAIRRAGELLKQVEPGQGGRPSKTNDGSDTSLTRKQAAADAGMSERQKNTALRIANVPEQDFEKQVEPGQGARDGKREAGDHRPLRSDMARDAGMSPHQAKQAVRVANVPEQDFEKQVEPAGGARTDRPSDGGGTRLTRKQRFTGWHV